MTDAAANATPKYPQFCWGTAGPTGEGG